MMDLCSELYHFCRRPGRGQDREGFMDILYTLPRDTWGPNFTILQFDNSPISFVCLLFFRSWDVLWGDFAHPQLHCHMSELEGVKLCYLIS